MKSVSAGCVLTLLAGCGSSGSALSSLASSYAASYCHFVYHCCTPSDRANPENPFEITASTEEGLGFATEQGCANSLGALAEVELQPYEDSVSAKRMSYDQAGAQACLSALAAATSACDPNAFLVASQSNKTCNLPGLFTGLAPAGGDCTMAGDCAAVNSACAPVDAGLDPDGNPSYVISGAATCLAPPGPGMSCIGDECAAGCCCSYIGSSCVAYVAEGAACDVGCAMTPCDPTVDYCDSSGTGECQPLLAAGGACNPLYGGGDCAGFDCVPNADDTSGTCASDAESSQVQVEICVGNPNGF